MAAWYASREARTAEQLARHDAEYARMMWTFGKDVLALTNAVSDGPILWRQRFVAVMHEAGYPLADEDMADRLFGFMCAWIQTIAQSSAPPRQLAGHYRDHLEIDEPHIPTEQEINDSYELESASSPDGQAFAYGGKTKDEIMRGLKSELDPTFSHGE